MAEEQFSKETIPQLGEIKERIEKKELGKESDAEQKERSIKQEIKEYIRETQQTPSFAAPVKTRDEEDEISKLPSSQQVGALISLVFEKGLKQAVTVARNLDNPAILDEFHDILVDRYYQELVDKKLV